MSLPQFQQLSFRSLRPELVESIREDISLDAEVGDKGMKGLTDETKRLAGQQKDLMNYDHS